MKRIVPVLVLAALLKEALTFLTPAEMERAFRLIPAKLAAFAYGVPLHAADLSFKVGEITLVVTPDYSAENFFVLVTGVLIAGLFMRYFLYVLVAVPLGWAITIGVNALRLVAMVPVESILPHEQLPIVHLVLGIAFFTPAFFIVWHSAFRTDL